MLKLPTTGPYSSVSSHKQAGSLFARRPVKVDQFRPARLFCHCQMESNYNIKNTLAVRPEVLLADEPVSMLDVSIRLDILNLLLRLKDEEHLALLYITHYIASARYFADDAMVMYAGQMIEGGSSEAITQEPRHPYTRLLLTAAPDPERLKTGKTGMKATGARGEGCTPVGPPTLVTLVDHLQCPGQTPPDDP